MNLSLEMSKPDKPSPINGRTEVVDNNNLAWKAKIYKDEKDEEPCASVEVHRLDNLKQRGSKSQKND